MHELGIRRLVNGLLVLTVPVGSGVTDTGGPVVECNLVLALISLSNGGLSRLSSGDGASVLGIAGLSDGLGVLLVEGGRAMANAGAPVLKVLLVLSLAL